MLLRQVWSGQANMSHNQGFLLSLGQPDKVTWLTLKGKHLPSDINLVSQSQCANTGRKQGKFRIMQRDRAEKGRKRGGSGGKWAENGRKLGTASLPHLGCHQVPSFDLHQELGMEGRSPSPSIQQRRVGCHVCLCRLGFLQEREMGRGKRE